MRNEDKAKKKLKAVADKVRGRSIKFSSLSSILNKEFKDMPVKFIFRGIKTPDKNWFALGGEYSCDAERTDKSDPKYTVTLEYWNGHPNIDSLPEKEFNLIFNDLYYILCHEFRHGYQERKRNHKNIRTRFRNITVTNRMSHYYASYDELDAYAYETALYMKETGSGITTSWVWKKYKELFCNCDKVTYNRFMKKVYLLSHK